MKFWDATNFQEMKEQCVWHVNKIGFCPIDLLNHGMVYYQYWGVLSKSRELIFAILEEMMTFMCLGQSI